MMVGVGLTALGEVRKASRMKTTLIEVCRWIENNSCRSFRIESVQFLQ
jgi:hypothetical protein